MKKSLTVFISLGAALSLSLASADTIEAKSKAKVYKNCTELNKDYKGGVAKSASVKNKGGKTRYKPYVSKELYKANEKKDRDKDGIACER